jgi:hypothetical protein
MFLLLVLSPDRSQVLKVSLSRLAGLCLFLLVALVLRQAVLELQLLLLLALAADTNALMTVLLPSLDMF